jgi:hypothetical protein
MVEIVIMIVIFAMVIFLANVVQTIANFLD